MKTILAFTVLCLLLASCDKAPQYPNTVSMKDGGYSFTESSGPMSQSDLNASLQSENVTVGLGRGIPGADSAYSLSLVVSTGSAFALNFQHAYAMSAGPGLYTLRQQDSISNICTELGPAGGTRYEITSGTVNITSATGTNVSGTFTLNISNGSGSSTITGTINAHQPTFYY